jgi:hypothetical protein
VLAAAARAGAGHAQRSPSAQAGGQRAAQRAATLDVQRLVDRLVRDAHRLVVGEVEREPPGDLLGTPRGRPAPVLAAAVPAAAPPYARTGQRPPVRRRDRACKPLLDVAPQRLVPGELRRLEAPRPSVRVPLGGDGPVLQIAAAGRRVAPQFP